MCVAALARIPSPSLRALQGNTLDAGNTVAMIHSTPTQIADFRAVVLSANIGEGDMNPSSVTNGPAGVS
jgi:hypothetical protein